MRDISDIEILEIEYLGETILEGEELIQSDLSFKKNNSLYSYLTILVPISTSEDIFKKVKKNDADISLFFNQNMRLLSDSIIFLYNSTNARSYIRKYRNDISTFVSDEFSKKNIYKIVFKIFEKKEYIYIDIDKSQLLV